MNLSLYIALQKGRERRRKGNQSEDESFISTQDLARFQSEAASTCKPSQVNSCRQREHIQRQLEYFNSWDAFYRIHRNQFFKDRHYLQLEHASISSALLQPSGAVSILDFGCGVGNSILPLLELCSKQVHYLGVDVSPTAVDILRRRLTEEEQYSSKLGHVQVHELDLTLVSSEAWDKVLQGFPVKSFDLCLMVFTMSAFPPARMQAATERCISVMKPGRGLICFRDYSDDDLAKYRFPPGQRLGRNWYVRQDGTFSFFFSQSGLLELFTRSGRLHCRWMKKVNRRITNRADDTTMLRSWVGCEFVRKSEST